MSIRSKASQTSSIDITKEIKFVSKFLRRKANRSDFDIDSKIDTTDHSAMIKRSFWDYAKNTMQLPLHPTNKLWLYSNYLIPKLCRNLTIADIDITWIKQNLDLLCHNYFRRWLNIPSAGTVEILQFSKTKFGMELLDISSKFTLCQITIRPCLKKSPNPDFL